MLSLLEKEIKSIANPIQAEHSQKYFRTGKGEYGEGDIFLGIRVPIVHKLSAKYKNLDFNDIQVLLDSKYHEKRLIGLDILVQQYQNKDSDKEKIVKFYLSNLKSVNNWDLVDLSCYKILGDYLLNFKDKNYDILKQFSKSENLWERRISIVSTMIFIKNDYLEPTLEISKTLLTDKHDLINKAVGWLLRELGKKDKKLLKKFLKDNAKDISSITLSYATERFEQQEKGEIKSLRKKQKQ